MKKFLAIGFAFITPVIALCVTAALVEWNVFRRDVRQPQAHIGILGDSLVAAAVNPEHFPEIANFAQSTTQPLVWRAKLDVILDENPQLDTMIVPMWSGILTRHPTMPPNERAQFSRGWGPLITVLDIFRTKEMGGFPCRDFGRNFIRGPLWSLLNRCVGKSIPHQLYQPFEVHENTALDTEEWKNGFRDQLNCCGMVPSSTDLPVFKEYDDIFNELKRRNIRIVILIPSLMPQVRDKIMANGVREWSETQISKYADKYGTDRLDLLDAIPEPECYQDYVHLNFKGAERFTKLLKDSLK